MISNFFLKEITKLSKIGDWISNFSFDAWMFRDIKLHQLKITSMSLERKKNITSTLHRL